MYSGQEKSLCDKLRSWALKCYIKRSAITMLLKVLKSSGLKNLPTDSRTLLKTPRKVDIEQKAGGFFWYYGVENSLLYLFSKLSQNIELKININLDGLPSFNKSPVTFWPILET